MKTYEQSIVGSVPTRKLYNNPGYDITVLYFLILTKITGTALAYSFLLVLLSTGTGPLEQTTSVFFFVQNDF